ncbi:GntR family transcriptional regulator [Agathobacter sp.]
MAIKYKWLEERLKILIEKSVDSGITRLPTESALCDRYKVSRQTVRQALSLLEKEGLIEKRQGSGSYITGLGGLPEQNIIELMLPTDSEYIYPEMLYELRSRLLADGFSLHANITHDEFYHERLILQKLLASPPRVLLVIPVHTSIPNPNQELYRALQKRRCHIIFLKETYPQLSDCICIGCDYESAAADMVRYLIEKGHHSIGAILNPLSQNGISKYNGFMRAMISADVMPADTAVKWLTDTGEDFIKKAAQALSETCTAVICDNDQTAYEVIDKKPPFEVFSFDNSYLRRLKENAFLSVDIDEKLFIDTVASTVKDLLRGQKCCSITLPFCFDTL